MSEAKADRLTPEQRRQVEAIARAWCVLENLDPDELVEVAPDTSPVMVWLALQTQRSGVDCEAYAPRWDTRSDEAAALVVALTAVRQA